VSLRGSPEAIAVGDLRTVVMRGDPAPVEVGGRYARIVSATVNESGEVAFSADLAGSAGSVLILASPDGSRTVLTRNGDPAPGGGRYTRFAEVVLGEDGRLLFNATVSGCGFSEGVFFGTAGGGLDVVARSGEPAPGDGRYASFEQLTLTSYPLSGEPYHRLAYAARTTDGRVGLVVWPSYTTPRTVFITGQRVAGGVLEGFVLSRLGLALCCIARVRYDRALRRTAFW
jgi:hypothetical protein